MLLNCAFFGMPPHLVCEDVVMPGSESPLPQLGPPSVQVIHHTTVVVPSIDINLKP